ncbi:MAG: hypothetical protein CO127_04845 [Ignavibacteria bacterium CG_4_9_14_3_um_filter_36_18]|nr:MAG: hypothetical protein CO127_04845 [Ignavibacteria bacterium CG_4_9_14_3_um_filter_36_18]
MKKMLLVEDDDLSIDVMRRIFENDFEMDICESAEEYYEKYPETIYDIILMDIAIKGDKNGFEFIKEIKASPKFTGSPIICLTAYAQNKVKQEAMEAGADVFITKPVTQIALKEAINSLLK